MLIRMGERLESEFCTDTLLSNLLQNLWKTCGFWKCHGLSQLQWLLSKMQSMSTSELDISVELPSHLNSLQYHKYFLLPYKQFQECHKFFRLISMVYCAFNYPRSNPSTRMWHLNCWYHLAVEERLVLLLQEWFPSQVTADSNIPVCTLGVPYFLY